MKTSLVPYFAIPHHPQRWDHQEAGVESRLPTTRFPTLHIKVKMGLTFWTVQKFQTLLYTYKRYLRKLQKKKTTDRPPTGRRPCRPSQHRPPTGRRPCRPSQQAADQPPTCRRRLPTPALRLPTIPAKSVPPGYPPKSPNRPKILVRVVV